MSKSESHPDNASGGGEERHETEILAARLREAGVGEKRSASVEEGVKACYNHDDKRSPTEVAGNYTVHGGDGLVLLDIDVVLNELPDWVRNLPSTFVVESPHGGFHLYYVVEDDNGISNTDSVPWGSIRYEREYCVGPGSTIDHELCDDGKDGCPGVGIGEYTIAVNKPKATLSGEHLNLLREACSSSPDVEVTEEPEEPDGDLVGLAERALSDLQDESTPTFDAVMDFLQGGIADFDTERLHKEDGRIDRSAADFIALSLLHSTLRRYTNEPEDRLRGATWATYTHYCRAHPKNDDGQPRRWTTDDSQYREGRLAHAVAAADADEFEAMVEKKGGDWTRRANDEYSELTYGAVWSALSELTPDPVDAINAATIPPTMSNDMNPGNPETTATETCGSHLANEYPSKGEVVERAFEIDDGYNDRDTYEKALQRLQREYGEVKATRIDSTTWVYYPVSFPDPPDACYVKVEGEKRDPEPLEVEEDSGTPEQENEQEIMTDGGVDVREPPEPPETHCRSRQNSVPDQDASPASTGSERESETDRPPPVSP